MAKESNSISNFKIIKTTYKNVEYSIKIPKAPPSKDALLSSEKAIFPYQAISSAFEDRFLQYILMNAEEFQKKLKSFQQASKNEVIVDFLDLDIEKLFDIIVDNSGSDTVTVLQSGHRGNALSIERSFIFNESENSFSKFKKIESVEREIYTESRVIAPEHIITIPPIIPNNGVPIAIALIAGPLFNFHQDEFELRDEPFVTLTGNIFLEGASAGPDGLYALDLNFTRAGSVKSAVLAGIQIMTPEGNTMVLYTSHIPLTTTAAGDYIYTLNNPVLHIPGPDVIVINHPQLGQIFVDVFDYTIVDSNYDSATSTISVQIVDDVAEANDNLNTVKETLLFVNGVETVTGNLLTDNDGFGIDLGADGIHILSVNGVVDGDVGDLDGALGSIKTRTDYNTGTGIVTGELTVNTTTGAYTFELIDASSIPDAELTTQHISTYTIIDADGDISSANLTVTVTLNQAPVANNDAISTNEDNPVTVVAPGVLINDTDPNAPDDTMAVVSIDTTGTIGNVTYGANGEITYDPNGQFEALAAGAQTTDSFTYTIEDAEGLSDTATVVVTINGVNDAPVVNNVTASGNEDAASISITLAGSDVDGTIDSFNLKNLPTNGILYTDLALTTAAVINTDYPAVANQLVLYFVPALNFNGDVIFNYAAKDDLGLASTADGTATITVISVNDAPVVNNVTASGNEDAASISITLAGSDVDGTIASFDLKSLPANGILYTDAGLTTAAVINTDYPAVANELVLYFVPALNFNGDVAFDYGAKDDLGLASTADGTATITVISVNDAPVVNNVNASGNEDAASISITLTGSDVDGTIASFDLKNLPANGILYIDATLTTAALINTDYPAVANQLVLYFAPALNFNGDVAFEYGAKDNTGDVSASTAVATISVASVNDAPAGTDTTVVVNEDTQYIFSAANFGFSDINDNPANSLLAVRITTLPGAGMLTNNGIPVMVGSFISIADINAGILRFNPAANANGIGYSSFTFQVRDNGGTANGGVDLDPNPKTITIDVMAVNDAPVVNNIEGDILNYPLGMLGTAQILDQGALATVLDVDSADFDGGVLTVEITANAAPAEDELGIQSTVGQIELTGSSVTYAGTEIGVLDAASTAIRLLINLNSDATPVSVAALISAITYTNTELVLPDVTARTVSFTVTDGDGGTSNTGNILVDVGDILPPVVLDLDGDGIELISAQNSNVSVEKNGMHYKVGWVGPNDAILAYDANHDGLVTDLSEINLTLYHPDAKTDLEGLKLAFDSNQDGIFDAADEHFKDFLIWQDSNQDGISQASEVTPLADSHIKAIHLNSDNHLEKVDGNIVFGTTTYETKQGEIFLASDLGLAVLPVQSPSALTLSDVLVLESTEDPIREMEEGSGLYQPVLPSLSEIMPEIDTFTHLI